MSRGVRALVLTLACAAAATGCGPRGPEPLQIRLETPDGRADRAAVIVEGVPSDSLLPTKDLSAAQWTEALRVTVLEDDSASAAGAPETPAVAGSYAVEQKRIVFRPHFGFDPGRKYRVVFDPARLPATAAVWRPPSIVAVVGLPAPVLAPTAIVSAVYPSGDVVPENQLRLYIHFSAPMGRRGGIGYVRLLDQAGHDVEDPFLPLDAEFWNPERTRFTVFFDPGRVKRGVLPHEQMGRALVPGASYTLVVARDWSDARGQPLREEYRRTFRAGPADERPLDPPSSWYLQAPAAGTRDRLIVRFPEPLDHGLLLRALGVSFEDGRPVTGEPGVDAGERGWSFTPAGSWKAANYRLVVMSFLEDLAGNRVGRAFEVDQFDRTDEQAEGESVFVPFRVSDQKR